MQQHTYQRNTPKILGMIKMTDYKLCLECLYDLVDEFSFYEVGDTLTIIPVHECYDNEHGDKNGKWWID